jgi:pyruvate-ferredoxin/flavodoxin oxidoreductase
MVMQAVFFKLAQVIPVDEALQLLKDSNVKMYGKKGEDIVKMNHAAVDNALEALVKVDVPQSWQDAADEVLPEKEDPDFIKNIQRPMARQEGDELPVSAFTGMEDGTFPPVQLLMKSVVLLRSCRSGKIDKCIQCGQCAYMCVPRYH